MLEDRRLSRGGEDGGRSRELMQQFSVLHYVVVVHNCVNKVYIAVLQLLVKLRRHHSGTKLTYGAVNRIGFAGQDRVSSTRFSFLNSISLPDEIGSQFRQGSVEAIINTALEQRKLVYNDG